MHIDKKKLAFDQILEYGIETWLEEEPPVLLYIHDMRPRAWQCTKEKTRDDQMIDDKNFYRNNYHLGQN